MAEYILKYSAGVYQRKITALDGYYSRLAGHLETLNTYHEQMKEFWDGTEESQKYYDLITNNINAVKAAMEDCKNTNAEYQKVVDEMTNTSSTVDQIVEDVKEATSEVVDVAGDVAKIAALII